jgi:hypothetical protein
MAGKPLRQEQVPARPVDVRDRGVPQRVERVKPIEPRLRLPGPKRKLDAALADTDTGLGAEERIVGLQSYRIEADDAQLLPECAGRVE